MPLNHKNVHVSHLWCPCERWGQHGYGGTPLHQALGTTGTWQMRCPNIFGPWSQTLSRLSQKVNQFTENTSWCIMILLCTVFQYYYYRSFDTRTFVDTKLTDLVPAWICWLYNEPHGKWHHRLWPSSHGCPVPDRPSTPQQKWLGLSKNVQQTENLWWENSMLITCNIALDLVMLCCRPHSCHSPHPPNKVKHMTCPVKQDSATSLDISSIE